MAAGHVSLLDESFVLYVFGEPLEQMSEWKFYENGVCEKEIDGAMIAANMEPEAPYYSRVFSTEILLVGAAVLVSIAVVIVYARTAKRKKQQ